MVLLDVLHVHTDHDDERLLTAFHQLHVGEYTAELLQQRICRVNTFLALRQDYFSSLWGFSEARQGY